MGATALHVHVKASGGGGRGGRGGAFIWRGDLTEGFCIMSLGGLYMEGIVFGISRQYSNSIQKCYYIIIVSQRPLDQWYLKGKQAQLRLIKNNLPCGGATSITSSKGLLKKSDSVEVKLKSFNLQHTCILPYFDAIVNQ